jgi:HSP20 family protein
MAMLPGRWDPWSDLASLHNTMDRLFGNVFGAPVEQGEQGRRTMLSMPVNVAETDTGYEVQAPVPGFRPDEIEVTFADGLLTIKAEHRQEQQSQQGQTLRREFLWADSVRQLGLSGEIDPDKIEASVEHGMLTVRVPKAASAQPRRIPIAATGGKAQLTGSSS